MPFGWELVVLHTTPSMFSKLVLHAWRECGGLKRTFYINSWRVKLILVCQEVLKWVWLSMNRKRLLFIQIQTIPPTVHHKWKLSIEIVFRTTNKKSQGTHSWVLTKLESDPMSYRITLMQLRDLEVALAKSSVLQTRTANRNDNFRNDDPTRLAQNAMPTSNGEKEPTAKYTAWLFLKSSQKIFTCRPLISRPKRHQS